ncbi:sugar phosphate isomerase/epimerase [Mycobacterium sp. 1245805.9]|uniref:sugar phosphate isomerase/epimerase family protein n=1 Tax=Mycobacterium sp. 1245805.9 TaxID=1856862 RepID=UPI0007FF15F8|nr:TIM barrel protein [Mycobacterium sp. 1245805.9]OBI94178.1 xylose isomerase [Mycobacterium sp. 1245805.9]
MQLGLTPDGKWDIATPDLVSAASAAGFSAVGINAERVGAAAGEAYAAAGVRCHELLAFIVDDDESATMASAERLADRAQTIGAEWVLTVFTDKVPAERIRRCARLFDDAGAGIAVEFTPLGAIPTISDGMEYVRAAGGMARAGLLIDSWHFCFSSNTWEDLAAVPLDDIAYVQFTDALEPEHQDRMIRESLHRRALPGEGVLELNRFAATLLDRGWEGMVSVEVLSARLRDLPVDELVGRLFTTTAAYWSSGPTTQLS